MKGYQGGYYRLEGQLFDNTMLIDQDETFLINVKKIDATTNPRVAATPKEAHPASNQKSIENKKDEKKNKENSTPKNRKTQRGE